jgi:hypothetical protein
MIDEFDRDQDGEINAEEFVVRTHRRPVSCARSSSHRPNTPLARLSAYRAVHHEAELDL